MNSRTLKTSFAAKPISRRAWAIGAIAGGVVFLLVLMLGLWFTTNRTTPVISAAEQQQINQAKVLQAAALDQIEVGNFEAAQKLLDQAITLTPKDSGLYYYLAVTNVGMGDYETAIEDYTIAIDANPHWALPLAGRGSAYLATGQTESALADYDKAIYLEPGSADLYTNRGQIYQQRGELDKALDDLTKAVQFSPDSVGARFNRGVLFYTLAQTDKAIEDFSYAINLDPTAAPSYLNRGLIYADQGQPELARADLQKFISLSDNPDWVAVAQKALADLP